MSTITDFQHSPEKTSSEEIRHGLFRGDFLHGLDTQLQL